ncbi:CDP-diacylglycerol--glycerol-3-phosphate 3-phosphatidyltransferase [Rhodovulum sp. DZ06]|uniref:CDP-diacylglycerol--glycerol-3-phosphate 3-phosphatidyltransferase n=1 Tax=Rhodovulum sp. DZ06 TaxID=3425126 RepID=UPI003D350099
MTDARTDPGAWTLPNLLTYFRVAAAPMAAIAFAAFERPFADQLALALFIVAAATDYLDGWLARRWDQVSALGRMLDPIADKAMVITALAVILALRGPDPLFLLPAAAILLRETMVSGLREALAGKVVIHVTMLAKWKTTVQMAALGLLLAAGWAQQERDFRFWELPPDVYEGMLSGALPDRFDVVMWERLATGLEWGGIACLWIAALLTVWTGAEYLAKGIAALREGGN